MSNFNKRQRPSGFQSGLTNTNEETLSQYRNYLTNKYESLLVDVINSKAVEMVRAAVNTFIENELRIWKCKGFYRADESNPQNINSLSNFRRR